MIYGPLMSEWQPTALDEPLQLNYKHLSITICRRFQKKLSAHDTLTILPENGALGYKYNG